jgi:uncharacterized membrane protein
MVWQAPPLLTLILCMSLAACASTSGDPAAATSTCTATLPTSDACATATPSYSADIVPIVTQRCLECHAAGNLNSSVVLETQSEIYRQRQLVETQVYRCAMPPSDGTPLTSTERSELLQWLVCGAPNN